MSKCIEWMRKASKRGIAFGLAAALVLSTLTASTYAGAAKQPKPALNTKRKTMYYDVFSRKTYNLKIKNIKASSIVSTKWKTSNKKVVAISKKKDKSVLLTAKKKGKVTITATVKYIPKGTFKISKKRLTCKVTSKSDGASDNFTPQPTGVVSPVPTDTAWPEPTQTTTVPTNTPSPDKTETPAPTETPVVTESPVPTDTPEPGNTDTPVIDAEAPAVESAAVTDYKTITVYFTEPVAGEPFVDVYDLDEAAVKQEPVLAEDGLSMTINSREALPAGTYNIIINGLADLAGNEMEADTLVQVEKEKSIPVEFVPRSERAPAGQGSFDVYFYVTDQYGQQCDVMFIVSDGELAAEAKTANGMLFKTKLNLNDGYVTVAGSPSAFAEGKVIEIVLTYTADGQTVCESMMHITMADAAGLGKPVEFEGLYAVSETMENTGTAEAPEFVLTNTEKNNVFDVSARFRDEFGYAVDDADVTYMIDDKSVLAFADTSGNNSEDYNTSDHGVTVKALAGGKAAITAFLSADDSFSRSMTVIVKPTNLNEIKVDKIDEGINGRASESRVTLIPGGSGITAEGLKYDVIKGEDRIKEIKFVQEADGIFVNITANTDGLDDDIQFRVRYDNIVSNVVTYKSVPLATPESIEIDPFETVITAGGEASTAYRLLNRYGENITKLSSKQPESRIGDNNIIKDAIIGTDDKIGTLTVQAQPNEGETDIELYMPSNPSVSESVHVEVQKIAHVDKILFAVTPSKGDLALNDTDNIIYAPIKVYNQYGEEYKNFSLTAIGNEEIAATVKREGIEQDDDRSDLEVIWCKDNGGSYAEAEYGDNITAVGIRWKKEKDLTAKVGDELTVSFKGNRFAMSEAGEYIVSVKPEREIVSFKFDEDCKAAVLGAYVNNTITAYDQYGRECDVEAKYIGIDIVSDRVKDGSFGSIYKSESEGTCKHGMTCSTKGTYTVRIYYKNSDDTTYDTSSAKGSYTLLVDDEKTLINSIEISDVVKVYNREDIVPKYITLDGQFVKVMRAATPQTTITFEGKAFTTYNGKKIEVSIRDAFGLLAIDSNGLVWSAGGTENVSAEMSLSGECKVGIKSTSSSEEGILSVTLKYIPNNIEAGKDVPVSCAQAAPQGEHKIVEYENNKPGDGDLRNTDYKMQKGSVKRFGLIDIDQYKEVYEDISLYTVWSADSNAVVINVDNESGVNRNTFTVEFGEGAEFGKAYEIRVYIDKELYYSFTVTMVETPAESVELDASELKLIVGIKDTAQLNASVMPENTTNKKIKWSSDNEKAVKVSPNGLVTAVGEGTAIITAVTVNGKKGKCSVTVSGSEETDVPKSDKKLNFTYIKDRVETDATVNLGVLDSYIDEDSNAWDVLDKLMNELSDRGGNGSEIVKYPDVNGDGKEDTVVIKKKADDKASLSITVGDEVRNADVTFSKTWDEETDSEEISATVVADSGKKYVVTVQSDDKDRIFVENNDGEMIMVEKTGSGYTIIVSDGFGITLGDVESSDISDPSRIVATTDQEIKDALSNANLKTLEIKSNTTEKLTVPEGTYSNVDMIVNLPNGELENNGVFKSVTVNAIAQNTFYEKAVGNIIKILCEKSHIVIGQDATATIVISEKSMDTTVENNGEIKRLEINCEGKVDITGESDMTIPVNIRAEAEISTTKELDIEATERFDITIRPGAESTVIEVDAEVNMPNIFGLGSISVTISATGEIKTVIGENNGPDEKAQDVDLTGIVSDVDGKAVEGAHIYIVEYAPDYDLKGITSDSKVTRLTTDTDGKYSTGDKIKAGNYYLVVKKDGYMDVSQIINITSTYGDTYTNEEIILVRDAWQGKTGGVTGKILDSEQKDLALADITVKIRKGKGTIDSEAYVVKETKTDKQGIYKLDDLEVGYYTIELDDKRTLAEGEKAYNRTWINVLIKPDETVTEGAIMSKKLLDGQLRFVLSWGSKDSGAVADLDAHLRGPGGYDYDYRFHTYFNDKKFNNDGVSRTDLDVDDIDYEGPETTTIYESAPGIYSYYVHNYTNRYDKESKKLSESSVKVEVYVGHHKQNTYYIPKEEGTVWHVFDYDSNMKTFKTVNTMYYEREEYYVGYTIDEYKQNIASYLSSIQRYYETLEEGTGEDISEKIEAYQQRLDALTDEQEAEAAKLRLECRDYYYDDLYYEACIYCSAEGCTNYFYDWETGRLTLDVVKPDFEPTQDDFSASNSETKMTDIEPVDKDAWKAFRIVTKNGHAKVIHVYIIFDLNNVRINQASIGEEKLHVASGGYYYSDDDSYYSYVDIYSEHGTDFELKDVKLTFSVDTLETVYDSRQVDGEYTVTIKSGTKERTWVVRKKSAPQVKDENNKIYKTEYSGNTIYIYSDSKELSKDRVFILDGKEYELRKEKSGPDYSYYYVYTDNNYYYVYCYLQD